MSQTDTIRLKAQDVSGQKRAEVKGPVDALVQDFIRSCLSSMSLPDNDVENRPLNYRAFRLFGESEGEGEHLNASDRVGDVLQEDDTVVLQPDVTAG